MKFDNLDENIPNNIEISSLNHEFEDPNSFEYRLKWIYLTEASRKTKELDDCNKNKRKKNKVLYRTHLLIGLLISALLIIKLYAFIRYNIVMHSNENINLFMALIIIIILALIYCSIFFILLFLKE